MDKVGGKECELCKPYLVTGLARWIQPPFIHPEPRSRVKNNFIKKLSYHFQNKIKLAKNDYFERGQEDKISPNFLR